MKSVKNFEFFEGFSNKPFINKINRQKILKFENCLEDKNFEYWKNVLFVDERNFNMQGLVKRNPK